MTRFPALAVLLAIAAIGLSTEAPVRANMAPPTKEFRIGLQLAKSAEGPRVSSLAKNGVAERSGLLVDDVILAIDQRYHKALSAGDLKSFTDDVHLFPIELVILRDSERVSTYIVDP
jgi:S1-C subfamily serine protease